MTTFAAIPALVRFRALAAGCAIALGMTNTAGAQPALGMVYADEVAARVCAIRCAHPAPSGAPPIFQSAPPASPPSADDLRDMASTRLPPPPPPLYVPAPISVEPIIPHAVIWQRRDRSHRTR